MPHLLMYDTKPVALIEALPNNAYGQLPEFAEAEVCNGLSPNEGCADIVEITDEEANALRHGETVDLSRFSDDEEDD